jgi:uncharacterized protein YbaR (Trm112 family)/ubiquinone/menaquinone biosynthesis C-methylase UbiE
LLKEHFSLFSPICIQCKQNTKDEHKLILQVAHKEGISIEEGQLYCPSCKKIYPILHGIPILVPNPEAYIKQSILHITQPSHSSPFFDQWLSQACGPNSDYELTKHYLSTYMWAHYNDQNPEAQEGETSNLPHITQELLNPCLFEGPQLDIGCSVGRGTFALAQETQNPTLGIDVNFSMIRMAQEIKKTGSVSYKIRQSGTIYKTCTHPVQLPASKLVDFWVVDAHHLPFPDNHIHRCHSTNLIDCLERPAEHLQELARIHNHLGYISIATPFDWSPNATPYDNWIGGQGPMYPLNGDSVQNLKWYFSNLGPLPELHNFEIIQEQDNIPWRIRIHNRSTMHYNLHLMSVRRKNGFSSTR